MPARRAPPVQAAVHAACVQEIYQAVVWLLRSKSGQCSGLFDKALAFPHAFVDAVMHAAEDVHPTLPEAPYLAAVQAGLLERMCCRLALTAELLCARKAGQVLGSMLAQRQLNPMGAFCVSSHLNDERTAAQMDGIDPIRSDKQGVCRVRSCPCCCRAVQRPRCQTCTCLRRSCGWPASSTAPCASCHTCGLSSPVEQRSRLPQSRNASKCA